MIRNAIVVMFDSWQFNYTGCYGNDWIKTPHFDRLATEGVLFENAYGNNMPTLPVRRSMLTGRITLGDIGWGPLRLEDTTIADLLWGSGIDTAMAYNSIPLFVTKAGFARSFGKVVYSRGFDNLHFQHDPLYEHYTVDEFLNDDGFIERLRALDDGAAVEGHARMEINSYLRDKQYWLKEEDHTVPINIGEAIKMLKERDQTRGLFLWIDSWDPHEPWDPPSVWDKDMDCPYDIGYKGVDIFHPPMSPVKDLYTEAQLNHIRMLFAEKITLCDKYFGELVECVRKLGMWENTLMWLTSDHGEPLGNAEHGHGLMTKCRPWPYEELVHIPLIIKAPGIKPNQRIKSFIQDCDCAPTILEWLNQPIPSNMTGKSLLPLMRGEVDKIRDFAVAGYYSFSWSIITEEWSYIHWLNKMEDAEMGSAVSQMYPGFGDVFLKEGKKGAISEAATDYASQRSLDGADQWTCTPSSKTELPEGDELYFRKDDPFQLNNIIEQNRETAEGLLKKLRLYMQDLD